MKNQCTDDHSNGLRCPVHGYDDSVLQKKPQSPPLLDSNPFAAPEDIYLSWPNLKQIPGRQTLSILARDLYELHLRTGISLDGWAAARTFVEAFYGPIKENHV